MCVPCQCLDYRLLMFGYVLFMISTVITVAMLVTEDFLLKTFTIQFEAFGSFTITSELLFANHIIFLFIHGRWQKTGITAFTTLRKRRWGVPNGIFHWEALVDSFLKRFPEGLGVDRILRVNGLPIFLRILPRTLVLHFGGTKPFIGAGAVEYFSEIIGFEETLFGLIADGFDKWLLGHELSVLVFLDEELLEQVLPVNWTLVFNLCRFSYFRKIILLLDVHFYYFTLSICLCNFCFFYLYLRWFIIY